MRIVASRQPRLQALVGLRGGGFQVAVVVDFQRAELQRAIAAPGDAVLAPAVDLATREPAFEGRIPQCLQGDVQVARIGVGRGGVVAEPEHREQARMRQQRVQRFVPVLDAQGGRGGVREGVVQGVHRGADDSARPGAGRVNAAAVAKARRRIRRRGRRSPAGCGARACASPTGRRGAGTGRRYGW